jgi:peptide/nickel transport system permease protein
MRSRDWLLFVARRLVVLALLLVVISFAIFSLLYISPGNVVDTLLGTNPRTPAEVAYLTKEYHLNDPFFTQYWIWASKAAQLKFGNSIQTTLPVIDEIKARLPSSLYLGIYAYILTMLLGVGGGIWAALRRRGAVDRGIVAGSIVALSTPAFVSSVFLIFVFAVILHLFPVFGPGTGVLNEIWHLTLPAIALALTSVAFMVKHTRAAMIGVLDQDYVTFARARGLSSVRVLFMYTFRNALIPIVTMSGLVLSGLIVGAVLVEDTFSLPGIGQLLVQSATAKDLPMVQGVALVVAVVIVLANLLADLVYVAVDPRIRLGKRSA